MRLSDLARTLLQGLGELTCCRIAGLKPDPELSEGGGIARPEGIDGIDRIQTIDLAQSFRDEVGSIFKTDFATLEIGQHEIGRLQGSASSVATFVRAFVTCA